jgi:Nucleotidyl transferase of unknown function (DUF2204)
MNLCSEWIELLRTLNAVGVRYLVIGGHAIAIHAEPRFTGDLDVWVDPTEANAVLVWKALTRFGAPLDKVSPQDFSNEKIVFQMGEVPNRVDILMGIESVTFEKAWNEKAKARLGGVPVHVISRKHLMQNKRAAGRDKDLIDLQLLMRHDPVKKKRRRHK